MKLLFVSYSPIAMDVTLPEHEPLGGSESCIAFLARGLARNRPDVTFACRPRRRRLLNRYGMSPSPHRMMGNSSRAMISMPG
jgi:hypothetical protein